MGSTQSKSLAVAYVLALGSHGIFDVNAHTNGGSISSRPAFLGGRHVKQEFGINLIQHIRGGDEEEASAASDTTVLDPPPPPPPPASAESDDGPTLDEKVNAAMRKLGLSPPDVDENGDQGECKDGVCPMPDAPTAESEATTQQEEQSATTATASSTEKSNINPHELAKEMAEEYNVDPVLAMAAIGGTSTFEGDQRVYHPDAARQMIQYELDLINQIPEDSDDVKQLESEGYDSFLCRRALAFAEGNMDDARAILIADKLDAEEAAAEEAAAAAAANDDEDAEYLAQLRAERQASEAPAMVEVKTNFDPTAAGGSVGGVAAGGGAPKNTAAPPQGMPPPAAKEKVVFEATTAQIQELVLESDVPVLLDIHAEWCGPCKVLGPILEEMAVKSGGMFRLVKVNSDNERPVSAALEITALPTVFGVRDGKIVHMFQGMPRSEEMMKNFMMGLFGAAPFSPPVTADEKAKYEELTSKLIKTAGAASFSFSAREKLHDKITSFLDALVEDDSVADVEDSATLVRTLISNIVKNPYEQKYRKINLSNKKIASKIGAHKKCLAILKNVGFSSSKSGDDKELVLHPGKKAINVAPLVVARDCIDKWIQLNRKAMAAAARKRQDEIDRARIQAEAEAAALEGGDADEEVEEEEPVDPTACNLKLRLDGKKKVHEVVLHQDDPLSSILDALSIDSSNEDEEVQITCVAKRLKVKSSDKEAMAKSLGDHGLMPSAAIVVSTSSSRAAAAEASSSLKERAAAKKSRKTGSHTMQSIGIYAKDDNNKAELIDGGGGVWYEHDVSDDEEEAKKEGEEGDAESTTEAQADDAEGDEEVADVDEGDEMGAEEEDET